MDIKIFASLAYILIFFIFSLFLTNFLFGKIKKIVFLNKLNNFLPTNIFEFYICLLLVFINSSIKFTLIFQKNFFFYNQDLLFITFFLKNYLKYILIRKKSLYYSLILFQFIE